MVTIRSVSQNKLKEQRQNLRQQRRAKLWQGTWQNIVLWSLAGGLVWGITHPKWSIEKPEQIEIVGNQFLSETAIHDLIPLSYPQSLLKIQPTKIAEKLEANAPIASATVRREVFPPRLKIEVSERFAIAIAQLVTDDSPPQLGYLDDQGVWFPQSGYAELSPDFTPPTLEVIFKNHRDFQHWSELYEILRHSAVKISVVDWQNPDNLILETELGIIHLGAYSPKFRQQIQVLAEMTNLSSQVKTSTVAYIDLRDPQSPFLQLKTNNPDAE